jgi:hypothetical protein
VLFLFSVALWAVLTWLLVRDLAVLCTARGWCTRRSGASQAEAQVWYTSAGNRSPDTSQQECVPGLITHRTTLLQLTSHHIVQHKLLYTTQLHTARHHTSLYYSALLFMTTSPPDDVPSLTAGRYVALGESSRSLWQRLTGAKDADEVYLYACRAWVTVLLRGTKTKESMSEEDRWLRSKLPSLRTFREPPNASPILSAVKALLGGAERRVGCGFLWGGGGTGGLGVVRCAGVHRRAEVGGGAGR